MVVLRNVSPRYLFVTHVFNKKVYSGSERDEKGYSGSEGHGHLEFFKCDGDIL